MASTNSVFCSLLILSLLIHGQHAFLTKTAARNPPLTKERVEKISKALSDAGFHIMSLILKHQLPYLIPCSRNNTITIFVPQDQYVGFGPSINLLYQVVPSLIANGEDFKVESFEEELWRSKYGGEFRLFKVPTCHQGHKIWATRYSDGYRINLSKVTHWGIYNDGHVIIHGVVHFFSLDKEKPFHGFPFSGLL
ncbi:hypothetical protein SLEP1_g32176 [Rubroshorea leprosula]|uniref:Uncharacterized protein n=1 Tax=Rubroshorea leprosula TaxID=152421 RepID=A0AAV5KCN7_9ROSI|nr:hypothetical protein SLEP1_g32176 [Rubroshorea leprosula]